MSEIVKLLNRTIELCVMSRRQKDIAKEIEKYNKFLNKAQRYKQKSDIHFKVATELSREFNKIYYKEGANND